MQLTKVASVAVLLAGLGAPLQAQQSLEYNRDIRPILADHCFACHGADSAARKADLRLDRRDEAVDFGAITPGKPAESELITRVFSDDPDLVMPPAKTKKQLTGEEKEKLKRWIAAGAKYQAHWSLIAPTRPALPKVKQQAWPKTPLDRFVLHRLESQGLLPAAEADPRTLFRRLHLDVTGLPPLPQDTDAFERDYRGRRDEALSEWIDRLMKTSAWGEHRARYWLDAARYGDTHGLHFDNYREMWPYRDWVIRSFNANQRFDQFTIEQIAGDLLPNPTMDQLIATGFQRCNITTNEGGTIDAENLANYAVDRVQTFGWVYLGLTTNCGQCHDHKFDPFTMTDFYSLAAFFRNTTQGPKDGNVKDGRGPVIMVPTVEDRMRWDALPKEIAAAVMRRDERKKKARGGFQKWLSSAKLDSLDAEVAVEDLLVHVPLNEGTGNEVREMKHPTRKNSQASETGDVSSEDIVAEINAAEINAGLAVTARKFKSAGKVTWIQNGKLGPAPMMKPGATFELGELGDFEKDQSFSYGAWVKSAGPVSAAILARMDTEAAYRGWDLWQNNRTFAAHVIDSFPNNAMKVSTVRPTVKPGQWQHVFVTYDGSGGPQGIKIYVDGKSEKLKFETNTLKPNASIRTKTPLRIGQRSQGQVFNGGAIQDVRVYQRRLSPAEVKSLAESSSLRAILATDSDKRTPQQRSALFDHYLVTQDDLYAKLAKSVTALESERETIRKRSPVTHIQKERQDSPAMAHILMRGAYDKPGAEVKAATPAALHPLSADVPQNRLGLARWVIDPANPLTARVTVNRFWQEVFGQGIVATPEDFGVMGALPSHPELLDWLAIEFRESGWDVKKLFKLMLMSATYRQTAAVTPQKLEQDRHNVLLSRGPRFRMDAEMVRDHALAVSGLLSRKMYGPGAKPYQPEGIWDIVGLPGGDTRNYVQDKGENLYRRTLYTFWKRMAPPPNMEAFNATSREVCTVRRERTNTPLQALVTLNDPQFVEAARYLAQQALSSAKNDAKTLDFITRRVIGRSPTNKERAILMADLKEYLGYYKSEPEDAKALIGVGESNADEKLDPVKLAAWTIVCNQVMNLDEALNK